jgi:hypothetical protein
VARCMEVAHRTLIGDIPNGIARIILMDAKTYSIGKNASGSDVFVHGFMYELSQQKSWLQRHVVNEMKLGPGGLVAKRLGHICLSKSAPGPREPGVNICEAVRRHI